MTVQLVTVTAARTAFRQPQANPARVDAARGLLEAIAPEASLLVLPGGYLRAKESASEAEVLDVAQPLVAAARRGGLALVLGVDACGEGWPGTRDVAGVVARAALPMWAVAWASGQRRAHVWRQRSTTSKDAAHCVVAAVEAPRTVNVGGRLVEVILGGEAFNDALRDAIVTRASSLTAAVLVAHVAAGARHWQVQRYFSTNHGLPVLRSVHGHECATNAEALRGRGPPHERELEQRAGPPWLAPVSYTFPAA